MMSIPGIILRIYSLLLRFYPGSFRGEFSEQMLLDFSDLATDARKKGSWALALFCLRELMDFPANLLRIHFKEGHMFKMLRWQPVNYGLRGALGFGLAFGLTIIIGEFVSLSLWARDDSIIGLLQVYFYDLFHTEHGLELISWIPSALASLITGLFLGIMVAFLFADRSKYARYVLITMLCWFLRDAVNSILTHSADLALFLGSRHLDYFYRVLSALSGAALGLIFYMAKSEKRCSTRMLVMSALGYPLIAYLYLQSLFRFSIIETPWMFVALLFLLIVYIGGIFFMAIRSETTQKIPWLVVVGAIGYPLLSYVGSYLAYLLPVVDWSAFPVGISISQQDHWRLMFSIAIEQSICGVLFGLLIGLVLGFQRKSIPPQPANN